MKRQRHGVYRGYPYLYARGCDVMAVDWKTWRWFAFEPSTTVSGTIFDIAHKDLIGAYSSKCKMMQALDKK